MSAARRIIGRDWWDCLGQAMQKIFNFFKNFQNIRHLTLKTVKWRAPSHRPHSSTIMVRAAAPLCVSVCCLLSHAPAVRRALLAARDAHTAF